MRRPESETGYDEVEDLGSLYEYGLFSSKA